jgi:hypothetical protein
MAVNLSPAGGVAAQFFDNNGVILSGGKLYTYAAGTTTPAATYTSSTGATAHTNPIILDSAGRVPSGEIWLTDGATYKFVLKNSSDVLIATYDNIVGINDTTSTNAAIAVVVANLASTSDNAKGDALIGFKQSNTSGFLANAVARTVNTKLQEFVSVLDFGADPTGTADSTASFNSAIATGKAVYIPNGTYSVADVGVVDNMVVYGESRIGVVLEVNTNGSGAFTCTGATNIRISNLKMKAKSGVTMAYGYKQTDRSAYTSYSVFSDIETYVDLYVAFYGFFIFQVWEKCRDGYYGTAPAFQPHTGISSFPAAYGQALQTNLNQVNNCQFFHATLGNAAVDIAYGANWTFNSCDFELLTTRAVYARGIFGITFQNGWFENVDYASVVEVDNSLAPNAQGSNPIVIKNCYVACHANNTVFFNAQGNSQGSVKDCVFTNGNASLQITNLTYLNELSGNVLLSGTWTSFLTNIAVYDPPKANQNLLPIGPTGLGYTNFTNNGFTSLANVASGIGLADNAVQFTLSNVGNAAYYTMPSKLLTFLQGREITVVATGYSSGAAGNEFFRATVWDSVATPSYGNYTANASTPNSILVNSTTGAALQNTYVNYKVDDAATSLKIGFWCGGNASTQTVNIESMRIYLGVLNPTTAGLN